MAEKLIDAGAVFKKIAGVSTTLHPNTLSAARVGEVIESMTAFLNSQPDASEPLRARIKELEDLLTRISDVEPRLDIDSTNYEDRDAFYESVTRFRAIKGGQDA